jgi:hypothetical protein
MKWMICAWQIGNYAEVNYRGLFENCLLIGRAAEEAYRNS